MNTNTLDESIQILKAHKDEWARLAIKRKQEYLRGIIARQVAVAERLVATAAEAKGLPQNSPLIGEEWSAGSYPAVRYSRLLLKTLGQIIANGKPTIKKEAVRVRPNGQVVIEVFPDSMADKLLFQGFRGEVWLQKEVTQQNFQANIASFYRQCHPQGRVTLILAAGNVSSIGILDLLTKLYVEGQVALLKLNPVNQYLGPFLEKIFIDLIHDGFVRLAYGGAEVGEYLCQHPDIDEIHMTGSNLTYDAIVYGAGLEGRQRKQKNQPRLQKQITSELGNVSPIIVVPGPWSAADLKFQCENIATQMINNCGFNCCAAKVLILPKEWHLADALMDKLRVILEQAPQRQAYYPGAKERYDQFVLANSTAQPIGTPGPGMLPWTLILNIDPADRTNICFTSESFCGILAQTALSGVDADEFLHHAIEFCNNTLWGTLTACILIHPKTLRALGKSFEDTLAELRYGSIGINHWPVLSFAWGTTTWGAFPGHTADNIQSGMGVVHNALFFDKPERSVVYGPFRVWPKPAWFITHRHAHKVFPKLVRMEAKPSPHKILGIILTALRG